MSKNSSVRSILAIMRAAAATIPAELAEAKVVRTTRRGKSFYTLDYWSADGMSTGSPVMLDLSEGSLWVRPTSDESTTMGKITTLMDKHLSKLRDIQAFEGTPAYPNTFVTTPGHMTMILSSLTD